MLNDEPGTTLVLQLAENGNLKDAFESNQYVFRFSRKIQWMKQLGQALEWIHEVWDAIQLHHSLLTCVAQSSNPAPPLASCQSLAEH